MAGAGVVCGVGGFAVLCFVVVFADLTGVTTSRGECAVPCARKRMRARPPVVTWRQVADPAFSVPAGRRKLFQPFVILAFVPRALPVRGRFLAVTVAAVQAQLDARMVTRWRAGVLA